MSDQDAYLDHKSLEDKRYTTLQRQYTLQATAKCADKVEIRWSNQYRNWRIYWRGERIGELLTGEKFNLDKVVNIVRDVKNEHIKEKTKQYQAGKEYIERKEEEYRNDRSRDIAKEWVKFGGRGKKSFLIKK